MTSKIKKLGASVAVLAVVSLITYGVGRWQGYARSLPRQSELEKQVEAAHAERDSVQAQLAQLEEELLVAQNYGHLMEARTALYRTVVDLERRNFGIANTHLQEVEEALNSLQDVGSYLSVDELSALKETIAQTDLNVAVNLQQQRNLILNFVTRLDQLIPESPT